MTKPLFQTVSATDLRINMNSIIAQLKKNKQHIAVTKSGKKVAMLISLAEYEALVAASQSPDAES